MELDIASLTVAERYKLLIGGIIPRPIAFVSSLSPQGAHNLAPFSFFCGVGSNPMTLAFCPANKTDGSDKDTLRNVAPVADGGTGEFVVNIASYPYIKQVAAAAEPLPFGQSEFALADLQTAPSKTVRPPRVALSPVCFECRTLQIIRTNPGAPAGGNLVLGEVLHVFVRDDLINDRFHLDPAGIQAVGRMGGIEYALTDHRFTIPMGRPALDPNIAVPPLD